VRTSSIPTKTEAARANPAKVEDFGDEDLLQHIDLARILIGEAIPLRRDARQAASINSRVAQLATQRALDSEVERSN
jgi:hypothetical protein